MKERKENSVRNKRKTNKHNAKRKREPNTEEKISKERKKLKKKIVPSDLSPDFPYSLISNQNIQPIHESLRASGMASQSAVLPLWRPLG